MHGIGPETADVLMLYVYERPVFIWDTYARDYWLQRVMRYLRLRSRTTCTHSAHAGTELTTAEHQRFPV